MNKKYKKLILIGVILAIGLIGAAGLLIHQESRITEAENCILEGKYAEALELLNSLDLKKAADQEKKEEYLKIINDFNDLSKKDNNIDKIELIEKFQDTYQDTLKNEIFEKLNSSLTDTLADLNERKLKIEELTASISKSIENEEMEDAEAKLAELAEKYKEVSIKDLKKKYEDKEKEIEERLAAAEEEERKAQQLKEEEEKKKAEEEADNAAEKEIDNSSNLSSEPEKQNATSALSIADTNAAQNSSQLITVVSSGGYYAELKLWQKNAAGKWEEYDSMNAMLGEGGMKVASQVYEMDMCTPTGSYSLTEAFGVAQNPGTILPYRVLDGSEYWIDDPDSAYYNTMQFGEAAGRWNSAEHLTDYQNAYQYSIVVDYNRWPVVPGKSSAIFLHCDVGIPTWGCIAVAPGKMVEILNWIESGSNIRMLLDFSYDNIYTNY